VPNDDCPLCLAIGQQLTRALAILEPLYVGVGGDSAADVRLHILAAICDWWMTESMKDPTVGPEAIIRCVANCLAHEHGVSGADRLTAVQLSRTT
jgi:hypothetical protein